MSNQGMTVIPPGWQCLSCVVRAVEAWARVTVGDLNAKLGTLYSIHHAGCDSGALRLLVDQLEALECGSTDKLSSVTCSWTVARLLRQVCGF